MKRGYPFMVLAIFLSIHAHAGIFDNTPFDPKTWHDTIRNTPFDPQTWMDTIDDTAHIAGTGCEMYAKDLRQRYVSKRGLNYTEKYYLRPWFGDLVDKVMVTWGASLNREIRVGGQTVAVASDAQTFGHNIYFRERRKTGDSMQMISLAHELLHAWQYQQIGESMKKFCRAYMDGYFRAGMDYYKNPLEKVAYDFEIKFAHWLAEKHPNHSVRHITYQTGSPYQRRTVEIPVQLRIPEPEYAVTCIENRTNLNLNYMYRWGDGEWKSQSVKPGEWRWHSLRYEGGQHSSPDLRVRFDFDLSGQREDKIYRLIRNRCKEESCRYAKKYHFAIHGDKFDLHDSEKR